MIVSASMRTDIPAFYGQWFLRRIREGFVLVRFPFDPHIVRRYVLDPKVVDVISFCTKNPGPMLGRVDELAKFRHYWFVTLTPYGREIEPMVGDKLGIIQSTKKLSHMVGSAALAWRYDPIFITPKYSISYHLRAFETIARLWEGTLSTVVVSFLDLYQKTLRNFPDAKEVEWEAQVELVGKMAAVAQEHGMALRLCCENPELIAQGASNDGCLTPKTIHDAFGITLSPPKGVGVRKECACLLGGDVGEYSTCPHGCAYCYANTNSNVARGRWHAHDPFSPLLIGHLSKEDRVVEVEQKSWIDTQLPLDF